ncbi:hypothetical protein GIY23_13005 [Allosaccharopolyspora coralli]|uniref:Uncharacterized protein n=1 Tax=Allosaccharopolyspora coralli TaxID=2665642 RepID=A0A5Q3QFT1_9PSEU|nr:hypothetical protein [Allosaccharopolyspora coralli]QGK70319.1 hypothetical protein GIY23_13005 [Allosaccharopolyspora coralli]
MTHSEVFEQSQWPTNPLAAAREAFGWLVTGPHPVTVNGRLFECLPDREVGLVELRDVLLGEDCPQRSRDEVWRYVIERARAERGTWMLVAVGLALPMLTPIAGWLTRTDDSDDPHDLCAEALRGLLDEVHTVDLDEPGIAARLRWSAYRAGHHALSRTLLSATPTTPGFFSDEPARPSGHPDLVLIRAVRSGVVTETEAALISFTRLDKKPLAQWPRPDGMGYEGLRNARREAEARLAAWLLDEDDGSEHTPAERDAPGTARGSTQMPGTHQGHGK